MRSAVRWRRSGAADAPRHGFRLIRFGAEIEQGTHRIDRFVEKPALELATQYVASGAYWWNSGIFVVRASVWLALVRRLQPAMAEACLAAVAGGKADGLFFRPQAEAFAKAPSDSIDYAVMERLGIAGRRASPSRAWWCRWWPAGRIWVMGCGMGGARQRRGGQCRAWPGPVRGRDPSYAHSEGRLVACVGTHNIVVVETADAVLVADRSHVQDIKGLVARIKADHSPEADQHRKVRRPWGFYDSIDHGERFQVKRIVVDPGATLSLQLHHHRAEHWVVVRGTAMVTRGEERFLLSENESTYIPLGVRHVSRTPARCRSKSSKCNQDRISAKTTSCDLTIRTAAAIEYGVVRETFQCRWWGEKNDQACRIGRAPAGCRAGRFGRAIASHIRFDDIGQGNIYYAFVAFAAAFALALFPAFGVYDSWRGRSKMGLVGQVSLAWLACRPAHWC